MNDLKRPRPTVDPAVLRALGLDQPPSAEDLAEDAEAERLMAEGAIDPEALLVSDYMLGNLSQEEKKALSNRLRSDHDFGRRWGPLVAGLEELASRSATAGAPAKAKRRIRTYAVRAAALITPLAIAASVLLVRTTASPAAAYATTTVKYDLVNGRPRFVVLLHAKLTHFPWWGIRTRQEKALIQGIDGVYFTLDSSALSAAALRADSMADTDSTMYHIGEVSAPGFARLSTAEAARVSAKFRQMDSVQAVLMADRAITNGAYSLGNTKTTLAVVEGSESGAPDEYTVDFAPDRRSAIVTVKHGVVSLVPQVGGLASLIMVAGERACVALNAAPVTMDPGDRTCPRK